MDDPIKIIFTSFDKALNMNTTIDSLFPFAPCISMKLVPVHEVRVPFFDTFHGPI